MGGGNQSIMPPKKFCEAAANGCGRKVLARRFPLFINSDSMLNYHIYSSLLTIASIAADLSPIEIQWDVLGRQPRDRFHYITKGGYVEYLESFFDEKYVSVFKFCNIYF